SGDSDPSYGYISGNDSYAVVIVGRFSATNSSELSTQIYRTLEYEQRPDTSLQYQSNGVCIASDQGPGDDNEMDYEHARNMRQDLLGYGYQSVDELYDGSQGVADAPGSPTATDLQQSINAGRGIMLYTGHGSTSGLGTTGFRIQDVATLANAGHLPFIWSVACVNGNFVGNTCFAEALLRAKDSTDAPIGALATLMSTINQSWDPPMDAQDEMVDILVESYPANRRHTFGGISVNGCMHMNDQYGSAGSDMTDTWTCFGDPSVVVRTATPHSLFVQHPLYIDDNAVQFTPAVSDDGVLICLSHNGSIVARGWSLLGSAMIPVSGLVAGDTLDVTATAYNALPYHGTMIVTANSTGIIENTTDDRFFVYPNPATDQVEIRVKGGNTEGLEFKLMDPSGRFVSMGYLRASGSNRFTFRLPETSSGIYFLELSTPGFRTVQRLVLK
ncbi:MAG: C25 family cysteine peptidase, partial [Bacteroidota bacterium]